MSFDIALQFLKMVGVQTKVQDCAFRCPNDQWCLLFLENSEVIYVSEIEKSDGVKAVYAVTYKEKDYKVKFLKGHLRAKKDGEKVWRSKVKI